MLNRYHQLLLTLAIAGKAVASLGLHDSSPIVNLPYGSFQGKVVGNLVEYLGIPFAAPPTGEHRFGLPQPPLTFNGIRNATSFGSACTQQNITLDPKVFGGFKFPTHPEAEDCLFINVVRPANISSHKLLPVVVYFFGGAFEVGDSSEYPGDNIVNRSIALNEPVIYVSANYRLNAFGFLGGKEVKAAGIANAGLYDQRFALHWVQKYIAAFGGNPRKVTIWGESAGGISVGLHLLINNGHPGGLFTGAIMESGFPPRLPDILDQQTYFDNLVMETNCTGSNDKLACLRAAPYEQLKAAVNLSPNLFSYQGRLAWEPMVDEKLIQKNPLEIVQSGRYAKVPFIAGDCEDEGTSFALATLNVTTNDEFIKYVKEHYFPYISDAELDALVKAYPDDVTQGSPFNTGTAHALTPEFKRFAALYGDRSFQAPRRFLLEIASKTQPAYAYRYMRTGSTAALGASHESDIPEFFGVVNQTDFIAVDSIIYFAHKRNPNAPKDSMSLLRNITWEKWSSSEQNPPLLTFVDPAPSMTITSDTYRSDAIKLVIQLLKK